MHYLINVPARLVVACARVSFSKHVLIITRDKIKMDSITNREIYDWMNETDLKPRTEELEEKIEHFLFEKFEMCSSDLEDPIYESFKSKILGFGRTLRNYTKSSSWKKEQLFKKHKVGSFTFLTVRESRTVLQV